MDRGGYDTFEILREQLDLKLRNLLQVFHLYEQPSCPSVRPLVGSSVGWSVCLPEKGGNLHFLPPIITYILDMT